MNKLIETEDQPIVVLPPSNAGVFGNMQAFEDAQRIAKALSTSTLVPKEFQGNISNTLIAMEMANRIGANVLSVMQNLYIVHGKPSWSSQFIIAALNSCGRFSPLRFDYDGESCRAWAADKNTGERLDGPTVTIEMAKQEGWFNKNGSKWKTMPELMMRYRAASFFGRLYAPDVLMGMHTEEEIVDSQETRSNAGELNDMLSAKQKEQSEAEVIETTVNDYRAASQGE